MLVQAQYWHDPLNEELYKQKSTFLSDINNEVQINQSYIDALQKIKNLVFVKFNGDEVLEPLQSEWFGFYKPGFGNETIPLNETTVWTKVFSSYNTKFIFKLGFCSPNCRVMILENFTTPMVGQREFKICFSDTSNLYFLFPIYNYPTYIYI